MTWAVENLSLFALIYLRSLNRFFFSRWESFIIRLDILNHLQQMRCGMLRIFHYSPWYTYRAIFWYQSCVENLSLFALIYLVAPSPLPNRRWESFIIRLDILISRSRSSVYWLRIFHYSPWYTYSLKTPGATAVENLSLFALIYLTRGD